jgi:biopolymer transport protein ExbD
MWILDRTRVQQDILMESLPYFRALSGLSTMPLLYLAFLLFTTSVVLTPGPILDRDVGLPVAATASAVPDGGLTIGIDRSGKLYLEDRLVRGVDELTGQLSAKFAGLGQEQRTIRLVTRSDQPYSDVLTVLDAAHRAHVPTIYLLANCPDGVHSLYRTCGPPGRGEPRPNHSLHRTSR